MRRIHFLFLLIALLAGCAASQEEEMVSDTIYGTVTSISEDAFTIIRDDNKREFSIPFDSDLMILDGNECTSTGDIKVNDQLMCTYTNGKLTVIEIMHNDNTPAN